MKVDCNRLWTMNEREHQSESGNRLRIVKDTCNGCKMEERYCGLNDLFKRAGLMRADTRVWTVYDFGLDGLYYWQRKYKTEGGDG